MSVTVGALNTFTLPYGLQRDKPVPAPLPVPAAPLPAPAAPAPAPAAPVKEAAPELAQPLQDEPIKHAQPAIAQLAPQIKQNGNYCYYTVS